ncbi:MAG: carboxypeptidase regulatory-like domain-containing protein [Chlorobi bacterium]|nr:carboxypeptidase regulatory-like domain-containing protein [Chlorobiota bacterium]
MKKLMVLLLGLIFASFLFTACSGDDTTAAPETKYSISGKIADANGTGVANVSVNLSGAATNSVASGTDGSYKFENLNKGDYTVAPQSGDYDFNPDSIGLTDLATNNGDNDFIAIGVYGTWVSEGGNIAPLLAGPPFNVAKLTATFNTNRSYTVVQMDTSGASIELNGTFTIEKSSFLIGGTTIFNIVLDQATPAVLTATGIFQIDMNVSPFTMQYEVVQTTPDIGIAPPTAEDGFGSTGGGAFGMLNVQKYVRQ